MKRTTINLTSDLHKRIKAAALPINVSKVASIALEKALEKVEAERQNTELFQQAVTRLRVSKHASLAPSSKRGFEHGWEWATNQAEYDDLVEFVADVQECKTDTATDWAAFHLPLGIEDKWSLDEEDLGRVAAYKKSFCDAVSTFWAKVEPLL